MYRSKKSGVSFNQTPGMRQGTLGLQRCSLVESQYLNSGAKKCWQANVYPFSNNIRDNRNGRMDLVDQELKTEWSKRIDFVRQDTFAIFKPLHFRRRSRFDSGKVKIIAAVYWLSTRCRALVRSSATGLLQQFLWTKSCGFHTNTFSWFRYMQRLEIRIKRCMLFQIPF